MPQGEVDVRRGQGDARERLAHVPELGGRGPEKLPPHRRIEEQVADLDRGAHRAAARRRGAYRPAAGDADFRAGGAVRRAASQHQPADLGDRRQRLAAEAQRSNAKQIVGLGDLACGVGGQGQRQLLGRDAAAVVRDADHLQPALRHRNVDPRRPRIDRVLHQLLDDARGPLDHLAGGDLVDQRRRQLSDGRHGIKRHKGRNVRGSRNRDLEVTAVAQADQGAFQAR